MDKQPVIYLNKKDNNLYLYPEAARQIGRDASIPYFFHNEKTDMVFRPLQNYSTLYHYCNIGTMMNIVRSKCLWLTNCQHSNDSQELLWSIGRLQHITDSLRNSDVMNISSKEQLLEYIKYQMDNLPYFQGIDRDIILSFLKTCEETVNAMSEINPNTLLVETMDFISDSLLKDIKSIISPTYISCFSSDSDSLGQWRGYGDDGRGVAIGFNTDIINGLTNTGIYLKQVIYHDDSQKVIMEKALFEYLLNPTDIKNWAYHILPIFKPFAFKEEQEWRLIFVSNESVNLKMNFYFKGNQMQGCYELPLTDNYITEIILGPKCNINHNDLILFFKHFGLNITEEQIIDSALSYR